MSVQTAALKPSSVAKLEAAAKARQAQQFAKARRRTEDILACNPPLTAAQLTTLIKALDSARKRAAS